MKPSELANHLRAIASRIDNSNQPSKQLVANSLKAVIAKIAHEPTKCGVKDDEGHPCSKPGTTLVKNPMSRQEAKLCSEHAKEAKSNRNTKDFEFGG